MPKVSQAHLNARHDEILDAAWVCFARTGFHETSMQDIFRESGLSAGAVYRYFPSKQDILAAIVERNLELGRLLVADARAQTDGAPLDALRVVGQTMLSVFTDAAFETTARVNIELWPEIIRRPRLREAMRRDVSFWRDAVTELLADAKAQGQLRPGVDPATAATLFICAYEGMRHYSVILPETFKPEALIRLGETFAAEATPPRPTSSRGGA